MSDKRKGFTHDDANNQSVEWYTPAWIFEKLDTVFDLDPCSPEGGLPWLPAKKTYSIKDNGLTSPWFGKVWLNPPYGRLTATWLERMHEHRNGISLVFARTDCKWYHDFVANADAILFIKGRIAFVDGAGTSAGSGAGAGSMLVAWGKDAVNDLILCCQRFNSMLYTRTLSYK